MPELVNMKRSAEDLKKEAEGATALASDAPEYPWGLRLSLRDEDLTKLGIKDLPTVGGTLMLMARVEVVDVSQYRSTAADGDTRNVGLQITDLALGPDQPARDTADILYDNKG